MRCKKKKGVQSEQKWRIHIKQDKRIPAIISLEIIIIIIIIIIILIILIIQNYILLLTVISSTID